MRLVPEPAEFIFVIGIEQTQDPHTHSDEIEVEKAGYQRWQEGHWEQPYKPWPGEYIQEQDEFESPAATR